jgi:uncharacterized protein YjbJ (UPF0337 family)
MQAAAFEISPLGKPVPAPARSRHPFSHNPNLFKERWISPLSSVQIQGINLQNKSSEPNARRRTGVLNIVDSKKVINSGNGSEEKAKGKIKEAIGKGEEVAGKIVGSDELIEEGRETQAEGKALTAIGEIKSVAHTIAGVVEESAHIAVKAAKNLIHKPEDQSGDSKDK